MRVGATAEATSVAGARDAAVASGIDLLKRALGHDPTGFEVLKVQVNRSGAGYRAYILATGE
jgi:hypothetical protein